MRKKPFYQNLPNSGVRVAFVVRQGNPPTKLPRSLLCRIRRVRLVVATLGRKLWNRYSGPLQQPVPSSRRITHVFLESRLWMEGARLALEHSPSFSLSKSTKPKTPTRNCCFFAVPWLEFFGYGSYLWNIMWPLGRTVPEHVQGEKTHTTSAWPEHSQCSRRFFSRCKS